MRGSKLKSGSSIKTQAPLLGLRTAKKLRFIVRQVLPKYNPQVRGYLILVLY